MNYILSRPKSTLLSVFVVSFPILKFKAGIEMQCMCCVYWHMIRFQ